MQEIGKIPSVGIGEEAAPEYSRNVSVGKILQADEILSDQHHTPLSLASMSVFWVSGAENTKSSVGTAPGPDARGSQQLEGLDLLSTPTSNLCFGLDQPHNNPSRPRQQYSPGHQSNERASMLPDVRDGQHFQHNLTGHSVQGRDDYSWPSYLGNRPFSGGYHTESYERTRLLQQGDEANFGSNSWPASLIGPYKNPLPGSAPATSAIDPVSHSYAISQTNTITDTPYSVPIYTTSSLPTSSYSTHCPPSHAQAAPQEQNSLQLTLRNQGQSQPVTFDTTNTLYTRQMPASPSESAQGNQLCFPIHPSMQPSIRGNDSGSRKRSRAVDRISANSTIAALSANPEGLEIPPKSFFTQTDQDNIKILAAAMNDMSFTEDNDGMIKSWNKLKTKKAAKLVHVCEDLLVTIKRATALQGQPLSDHKRSSHQYPTFESRFNAVSEVLKTQKTVCKHLLEDPYLYQVVDDPVYASMRVTNNRRVNKGKKDAIEQGRKLMGLKGNGKGHPLVKKDSPEVGDGEDDYDEEHATEERFETRRLLNPLQLKRSKRAWHASVHESIEEDDSARPIKVAKRTRRGKQPRIQDAESAEISVNASEDASEGVEVVKTEQESDSPYGNSISEEDLHGPLSRPLVYYFGSQEIPNDNVYSFNQHPFGMTYGTCPNNPYQAFDQPSYTAAQQFAPQQMIYPRSFNSTKFDLPNTFDGYHEPEPYDNWLDHNPHA